MLSTLIAAAATLLALAQPKLVQPESLEQGFIILVTDKSGTANASSPIHLASSHNGWNPNDPAQRLTQRSDGKWQIVLPKPVLDSRMAFKFARGSWETAETAADFGDIQNRNLPQVDISGLAAGEKPVIELVIETFADKRPWEPARLATDPYRPISATGTVRRVEVVGGGTSDSMVRDLLVWLPPGYDDAANADRRYPVLYLMDGQNVFEQLPGVPGEWKADETATALIAEGQIEPLIIVGIPHAGAGRISEYLPAPAFDGVEPRGAEFVAFMLAEAMPRVERAFRTKTGPENTAIGGASMGGIISLYAGMKHPEVFGKVLCESPAVLARGGRMLKYFTTQTTYPARVVIGMGGREAGEDPREAALNERYTAAAREMDQSLGAAGLPTSQRLVLIDETALHNEQAWAARLPKALIFLFPAQQAAPAR